ncbi:MAG: hypothetical protein A2836_01290 [Candidatus Taylorbacteria bacterium RIFCSPHIGHO2_01_FULL_45_63]|uniref:Uncharacterized protein n=1 Tax=Candidatus Taylorbacteria bacterium RIFCSPHIGHO2_02_FULL_45_35 TaxID=1802311 RepID=A0A1G2MPK0_9BACT|nr:MAG: hypothetical protein A2836_01290 [Candidatus Taylorbacteria bacterium RIFCSPHIGHO2_01_FULL_45_63]OHA25783.1 MAG: hypothetical protein A3D56_01620 [Candidatus Taylorbacteria bacterium RIFCSPHIGHO2_02_FULL_45_35]OHA32300.1 MAG: hypothetical protein A3A22_01835 [Candidatus Taylorbacteria bacterium RIFCSPLOWO2_01_FULL_45_34b]
MFLSMREYTTLVFRWSVFTAVMAALFWSVWWLFAPVPIVSELGLSRWWDILGLPIIVAYFLSMFCLEEAKVLEPVRVEGVVGLCTVVFTFLAIIFFIKFGIVSAIALLFANTVVIIVLHLLCFLLYFGGSIPWGRDYQGQRRHLVGWLAGD